MKTFILLISLVLTFIFSAKSQTTVEGTVTEKASGDPIGFTDVALYLNGNLVTGAQTDFDGYYSISNLDTGTYDVEATYLGMVDQTIKGINVRLNQIVYLNFELDVESSLLDQNDVIIEYRVPLDNRGNVTTACGRPPKDNYSNLSECGCHRKGCIHTLPSMVCGHTKYNFYIDGVRMDKISSDKKYWFTPLDSLGPQGLSPEYSSSLNSKELSTPISKEEHKDEETYYLFRKE